MNRKRVALCLLVLAFAGSLVYSFLRFPRQERVATLKYRPGSVAPAPAKRAPARPVATGPSAGTPASSAPAASTPAASTPAAATPAAAARQSRDGSALHIALLERQLPRSSGYRRNIFAPIFRDEVKPPPFKPLPLPPKPTAALPPPPPVAPPAPPPPPTEDQIAAAEMAKFTFLGFLKKDGAKTVFLSSNNEIFLAKKGSKLGQKYEISDLTDDAITIKALATGRELVIPLMENRALSTRRIR